MTRLNISATVFLFLFFGTVTTYNTTEQLPRPSQKLDLTLTHNFTGHKEQTDDADSNQFVAGLLSDRIVSRRTRMAMYFCTKHDVLMTRTANGSFDAQVTLPKSAIRDFRLRPFKHPRFTSRLIHCTFVR
jgi:hypothetical protein